MKKEKVEKELNETNDLNDVKEDMKDVNYEDTDEIKTNITRNDLIDKSVKREKIDKREEKQEKSDLQKVKNEEITIKSECKMSELQENFEDQRSQAKTDIFEQIENEVNIKKSLKTPEKVLNIETDPVSPPPLFNMFALDSSPPPEVPVAKTPEKVRLLLTPELPKIAQKTPDKLEKSDVLVEPFIPASQKSNSPNKGPIKMKNICSFLMDIETGGFPKATRSSLADLSPLRFDDDADMKEEFEYKMHW